MLTQYVPLRVKQKFWSIRERVKNGKTTFGRLAESLNEHKDLRNKFCHKPWEDFDVQPDGDVYMCCKGWLEKPIGNLHQNNLWEIWNSKDAQAIRKSILDGSFRYCNQDVCWPIQKDQLLDRNELPDKYREIVDRKWTVLERPPEGFGLLYDRSCNLSCPSCRRELIYFREGPQYQKALSLHKKLMEDLFSAPHDRPFRMRCSGAGDPFASPIFRDFLFTLKGSDFPNVVINLTTNGVLFNRAYWDKMSGIHKNIGWVIVSFDAATAETYAYTRRGGNFAVLLKNFEFLNELRRDGLIKYLKMDFVVQQKNYREMPDFIRLAKRFGHVDSVGFALITNWGTYPPAEFKHHAIWRPDHPELSEFLQVLTDPMFDDPIVDLKNLVHYRELATRPDGAKAGQNGRTQLTTTYT